MNKLCIVIPCYNEEQRFPISQYESFLKQEDDLLLCFVNDGSTDRTESLLLQLANTFPAKVSFVTYKPNKGKAEAVRAGMLHCQSKFDFTHIGFIDADLSASLEETMKLRSYLKNDIEFCFGSRILKVGSAIETSPARHYSGRVIATFISDTLGIKVYDTQCGCKLFTKSMATDLFAEPFMTTWLFDVELFARLLNKYGKQKALTKMIEVPLDKWINKEGSKVEFTYFFRLWTDLLRIRRTIKQLP